MKVSLKWLKEYVPLVLPPARLAEMVTAAGTEVAHLDVIGGWENVFVGQIVGVSPHPNADRLRLATVELGGEQQTVVCGAPNLNLGDKIAFARVGAKLTDGHTGEPTVLKPAVIRGVTSAGMVCSEKELGLSQAHEGIIVLPPEAPLGMPLAAYMGDVLFDLEVTPNRPDLLSMLGVAHEVGALTRQKVNEPKTDYVAQGQPIEKGVSVEIEDPGLCPRYSASLVTGVRIAESPAWLKERLLAAGIRAINNVVDITNYVMLEYGQPLHAFDYDKITQHKVIIRRAKAGEKMTTLDGVARELTPDTLVIADSARPIAVAGVMGGATSEVSAGTTSILLESASFLPASVHHTSARLVRSEASMRFERGVSPFLTLPALRRATRLLVELGGGTAAQGVVDLFPGQKPTPPIPLSRAEVKRLLGADYSQDKVMGTLTSLGCIVDEPRPEEYFVSTPYWRSDLRIPADLVEEVARIQGYDTIPYARLASPLPEYLATPMWGFQRQVRRIMAGFGGSELMTYSYTSREVLEKGLNAPLDPAPLRLSNPMAADQECLRTSLRGSLLAALAANLRHTEGHLFIFETSHVYLPRAHELPSEPRMLCALLTSAGGARAWQGRQEPFDFYDAKGVAEGLLGKLGTHADFVPSQDTGLRPGYQAQVLAGEKPVGVLGQIHPQVAQAFELPAATYLVEINLSELLPQATGFGGYTPLARFPAVVRDLALIVDAQVTNQDIVEAIQGFKLVQQVALFDVYAGKQVPPGKKSLAYSITFQSPEHTLTDAEVDGVLKAVLKKLGAAFGATLRT